ncbi:hypothetical protein VNO77_19164 [Canavalia gladiata]|uniref:Uncharacterized protein n=1 Tax=Canavalia gladiata TaxID=3824 RepID=A0AAN9LM02_CANGL
MEERNHAEELFYGCGRRQPGEESGLSEPFLFLIVWPYFRTNLHDQQALAFGRGKGQESSAGNDDVVKQGKEK